MSKYLRFAIIVGVFLTPFIAFIVPSSLFFPFITGKNFTFRILVEILLGLYIVLAVREPQFRVKFSWLLGAFAIFVAIVGLADALGENSFKSFWSNYERMEGYVTFLHLFAYFVIAGTVLSVEKLWERLFQTMIGASILMAFYAVLQYAGVSQIHQGSTRVDAALGNSTYYAIYVVLHIFIALFLFLRHREGLFLRVLYGGSIALNLFVLYQTATRGSILGFIGGVLLASLIIALFERDNKRLRKISIGLVGAVLVLVLGFVLLKNTDFVQKTPNLQRFASISWSDTKTNPRILIWRTALEGFKERPVLGWGQENFNYVFNKYYSADLWPQEQWFDRTHNVIMDWLIAGGLLGLLGYLSLYLLALFYIWKKGEFTFTERAVFTGMLGAYFFHNLFVFDNLISLIFFGTFLAYLHAHATRGQLPAKQFSVPDWMKTAAIPTGAVVSLALLYCVNWNAYMANTTLIQALMAAQQNQHDQAIATFKKALAYDTLGNQEIREQLMQYSVSARNAQGIPQQTLEAIFNLINEEMQKMIAQAPNDTRHHLFYGTVLDAYGQTALAEQELKKALETSPQKQAILFQLGTHYLNTGDKQKALENFKKAFDAAPEYREARIIYAMGLIYAGDLKTSDEVLSTLDPATLIGEVRILRSYIDTKHFDRAVAMAKAKIAQSPGDPNNYATLAAVYYQAGDKKNAIATVNELIKLNPQFKDQGEALIKQIQEGK